MAAPARALLSTLLKGHEFPTISLRLTKEDVTRYLDAVEDRNTIYLKRGLAPPLAVAARALGALLETTELPSGSLHTGQEIETHAALPLAATLTLAGRIAQRSERVGMVISVLEFEVTVGGAAEPALSGRTTVMAPAPGGGQG